MDKNNNTSFARRTKNHVYLSNMVYGKIPPQAKDLEESILGAIMLDSSAFDVAYGLLKPECFYVEAHKHIFSAMKTINDRNNPIDILTVTEELKSKDILEFVGGQYYITRLTNTVVSSTNIEAHSKIVLQKHIQRELIRVSGDVISMAYQDSCDPFDLINDIESKLTGITTSVSNTNMTPIDIVLVETVKKIQEWRNRDDKTSVTGISSGITRLDMVTRGWQNGDFIIIAARPSVGKTAFSLEIVKSAAKHLKGQNKCVALFSLEMKATRLILRMLAASSKVWLMKIQTGNITEDDMKMIYTNGIQLLSHLPIMFNDKQHLTISSLKTKARILKRKHNLGLIVIDYLQLMTPEEKSGQNREQEVSKISRSLKNLAQELDIPIIALSQLSRDVEKRSNPEPQPSDLRESGSLEQDADIILFLYKYTDAEKQENIDLENRVRVKIAKQRDGMLDNFDVSFKGDIQLFENIDSIERNLPSGNWRPISNYYEKE